jgi:hypothetical protein
VQELGDHHVSPLDYRAQHDPALVLTIEPTQHAEQAPVVLGGAAVEKVYHHDGVGCDVAGRESPDPRRRHLLEQVKLGGEFVGGHGGGRSRIRQTAPPTRAPVRRIGAGRGKRGYVQVDRRELLLV